MPEFDRLSGCIEWIDSSLVERRRTPKWAIQVSIRYHIAGMSTRDASQFSMSWESNAVTSLSITGYTRLIYRPVSTASADQFAVDEKVIRINGNDCWLYGAVDPKTSEILQFRLFPMMTKQTTRWFLAKLH